VFEFLKRVASARKFEQKRRKFEHRQTSGITTARA
jgi:hypothetical protein